MLESDPSSLYFLSSPANADLHGAPEDLPEYCPALQHGLLAGNHQMANTDEPSVSLTRTLSASSGRVTAAK